jgi:hypothetical protein
MHFFFSKRNTVFIEDRKGKPGKIWGRQGKVVIGRERQGYTEKDRDML